MVKEVGAGVNRGSEVISAVWEGGKASDRVVLASVSIRRSFLAHWCAFFLGEAAGMMVVVRKG